MPVTIRLFSSVVLMSASRRALRLVTPSCRGAERSRGHLGLYNVDTIIRKHYGAGYGLRLENRKDGPGTVVTATLPLVYKEA